MERDRFLGVGRDMRISLVIFRGCNKKEVLFLGRPLILIHYLKRDQVQRDCLKPNNAVLNIVMETPLYSLLTELNKRLWTSPAPKTNF